METKWWEIAFIISSIVAFVLLMIALFNMDEWLAALDKKNVSAKVEYYQNQIERQKGGKHER